MKQDFKESVALPAGVTASLAGVSVTIKGPKGTVSRVFREKGLLIKTEPGAVMFEVSGGTKREKRVLYSTVAHVRNMVKGVQNPYVYKLKICSSHFPMTAAVQGGEFVLKNFLGEKVPRRMKMRSDVSVKVAGSDVIVESPDRDAAGQIAGAIELLTFIAKRDRRVFQDGIHLYEKPGREF
jgi:large subunit ribosomal protein L6